uniref:Uncharacterized protein n=1 Tax=Anguilla anguilla TaxID=7936 RepID=A0A0E9R6P0_ANGAN
MVRGKHTAPRSPVCPNMRVSLKSAYYFGYGGPDVVHLGFTGV